MTREFVLSGATWCVRRISEITNYFVRFSQALCGFFVWEMGLALGETARIGRAGGRLGEEGGARSYLSFSRVYKGVAFFVRERGLARPFARRRVSTGRATQ